MVWLVASNAWRRTAACLPLACGLFGCLLASSEPARAMDMVCVESSRYVHLFALFGGDRGRFTTYFGLDPTHLPPPEACRAALLSGKVAGDDGERLTDLVASNGGWLDTLYLDSSGGDIGGGLHTAIVARDFWLKTRLAPGGGTFVYEADFGPPKQASPPDPDRLAYERSVASIPTPSSDKHGAPRCASACTFTLAAGVDRRGIALVHRPTDYNSSISVRAQNLQGAEASMMRLYKTMDVGDAFMATAQATARQTVSPAVVSRYPRFVEDAFLDGCKSDGAQLDDLAALHGYALTPVNSGLVPTKTDGLKAALAKVETRRQDVGQCVAALYEKERLRAFHKLCRKGCTGAALRPEIDKQIAEMVK